MWEEIEVAKRPPKQPGMSVIGSIAVHLFDCVVLED